MPKNSTFNGIIDQEPDEDQKKKQKKKEKEIHRYRFKAVNLLNKSLNFRNPKVKWYFFALIFLSCQNRSQQRKPINFIQLPHFTFN